jgi:hypothetical protein
MRITVLDYRGKSEQHPTYSGWTIAAIALSIFACLPLGLLARAFPYSNMRNDGEAWIVFGAVWDWGIVASLIALMCCIAAITRPILKRRLAKFALRFSFAAFLGLVAVAIAAAIQGS